MRSIILIIFSICFIPNIHAQIYEVGAFLGGSNFIGDVGRTNYIAPNSTAGGLLFKWNRSPRHSYRASVILSQLKANDKDTNDARRQSRNFSFENTIVEISAGMEFTFLDFDLHSMDPQFTPYLYTGISTARHKNYFFDRPTSIPNPFTTYPNFDDNYNWAFGIPMVLGLKTTVGGGFILAAEVGVRYTFSDKIDGSIPDDPDRYSFGNKNSNDWYVFSGITLTYTFGQKPCYCYY